MASNATPPGQDLSEAERRALHEVELGLEHLLRAQGHLVQFHHATGRGMDHLDCAVDLLREAGHADLADELRCRYLPQGVTEGDRWSYSVLEGFQDGVLADVQGFESRARSQIADGRRHVLERRQEHEWRSRAEE